MGNELLHEFDGTPLQNIAKGAVDLGELTDENEKQEAKQAEEKMQPVVEKLKQHWASVLKMCVSQAVW